MPRSKRHRSVVLTKVKKKDKLRKAAQIERIHNLLEDFDHVFVFEYSKPTPSIRIVRSDLYSDTRMLLAKPRVMAVALGRTEEESQATNLYKLTPFLKGNRGLLFTNRPSKELKQYLQSLRFPEYATPGEIASSTFTISRGPLDENKYPVTMDPLLRRLGLSTKVSKGVIDNCVDYTVCEEGEPISNDGCKLLRLWGQKLSVFRMTLVAHWRKSDGIATVVKPQEVS